MIYILLLIFLSSCEFLMSPLGLLIEKEVIEEAEKIIEHQIENSAPE